MLDLSIIICTYNRCSSLQATLESVLAATLPPSFGVEVVVIDNNSSDGTASLVERFQGERIPIRYHLEKNQGLSFARNRGIREADGSILAFIDDDVLVDEEWLVHLRRGFSDPTVACAGGRIIPLWEKPCPRWLGKELHPFLAVLDLGNSRKRMDTPHLWGANLVVRKEVFSRHGMFDTSLGRVGGKLYGEEEVGLVRSLIAAGEGVYYLPQMSVRHCIGVNRMKKNYFRKWMFDAGELDGILLGHYPHRNIFGIPCYYLRTAAEAGLRSLAGKLRGEDDRFIRELSLVRVLGFISGRLKYYRMLRFRPQTA